MFWLLAALGVYGLFILGAGCLMVLWAVFELVRQVLFPVGYEEDR